jgi:hypothetical protein
MKTMTGTHTRIVRIIALTATLAALAAPAGTLAAVAEPTAAADNWGQDAVATRPAPRLALVHDLPDGVVTRPAPAALVRDVPDGYQQALPQATPAALVRDVPDGFQPQLYGSKPTAAPAGVSSGFDWADAAIGAGVAGGLLVLLGSLGVIGVRRRRTPASV